MDYTQPDIIKDAGDLLRVELPKDHDALVSHTETLQRCLYDIAESYTKWLQLYHESRFKMLWPKDKTITELDRTTRLHASTAIIERDYEMLGITKALVENKLELCFILLKN